MRQSTSPSFDFGSTTATSHSSRAQTSLRHQSPEPRHGPEAHTICPRMFATGLLLRVSIRVGFPSLLPTSARHAGRKIRKPITHCRFLISDFRLLIPPLLAAFGFFPPCPLWSTMNRFI